MNRPDPTRPPRVRRARKPPLPDSAGGWVSIGFAAIAWAIFLSGMGISLAMSLREDVLAVFSGMLAFMLLIAMAVAAVGGVAGVAGFLQPGRRRTTSVAGTALNLIAFAGSLAMATLLMGHFRAVLIGE